jgi:Rieske Fe-S protein
MIHKGLGCVGSAISGRTVLLAGIGVGFGLSLESAPGLAQDNAALIRPKEGDLLVKVGEASLEPLTPADIAVGAAQVLAWPMDPIDKAPRSGSRLNQLLLLRVDSDRLSPSTRLRAADGVVAYTAICTHNGCEVVEWSADEQLLSCPCHFARYDPRDGARVVDGPAPRALPALPLKIVGGKLVVAGPLSDRVGFQSA